VIGMTVKLALRAPLDFKPSTHIDLENGRPMELEPIIGSIVDRAKIYHVNIPRLEMIYTLLKINQNEFITIS